MGNETKEEKEDELASGSRAWEKGKEDPTSGSLGKEAEVEKEDKLAFGRALVDELAMQRRAGIRPRWALRVFEKAPSP